jgi:hypothetical protein
MQDYKEYNYGSIQEFETGFLSTIPGLIQKYNRTEVEAVIVLSGFIRVTDFDDWMDDTAILEPIKDTPNKNLPYRDECAIAEIMCFLVGNLSLTVSISYYASDNKMMFEEAKGHYVENMLGGMVDSDYEEVHGSEQTGYVYTDQSLMVGGHDLLAELESHSGKYLNMEIKFKLREATP